MTAAKVVRQETWDRLREVALPDSRFHLNFAEIVPDFVGNDRALARIYELPCYQAGHLAFVAPDNCLAALRAQMLRDGLTMVVSTYGIYRGLVLLEPGMVPEGQETFAGWLDGLEHFGRTVTLGEISGLGPWPVRFDGDGSFRRLSGRGAIRKRARLLRSRMGNVHGNWRCWGGHRGHRRCA